MKDIFLEHLNSNEPEPVFVIAHKGRFIIKLLFMLTSFPMLMLWSVFGFGDAVIALILVSSALLLVTGAYKEYLIGLTDKRLIVIELGITRKTHRLKSIELLEIKSFDSASINNSFWVVELLDGSVLKLSIDRKEDENPDQKENAKRIAEFLQGLTKPAYTIA